MKTGIHIIILTLAIILPYHARAQTVSVDPVLTGMILEFTQKAKSQYKSQEEMMALETTGHIWLKEEMDKAKQCQEEFDKYLSVFRSILGYAAQTYGFYYEINNLCNNMGRLTDQIGTTPTNAIAVALHNKRNDIYVSVINKSLGIVNTIRQVCIDKKMTERQRVELVFSIRPQLQQMNRELATLIKLVKCTNMGQVWYGIERKSLPHREGKAGIIEDCLGAWRVNAKSVKPRK